MSNQKNTFLKNNAYSEKVRTVKDRGTDYFVIPVTAAKTGIMNRKYYSADELGKSASKWNNVPVCVNHPLLDGKNISANDNADSNIGVFNNVEFKDDALKGEIWLNILKTSVSGFNGILNHFRNRKKMEVSTGLYCRLINEAGEFNSEKYEQVVTDIRPDHLALLPNEEGACSIAKGCGVFNKDGSLAANQNTAHEKEELIRKALNEEYGEDKWDYLEDYTDTYIIVRMAGKYIKVPYLYSENKVTLTGIGVEVIKKIEFVAQQANSKESKMDKNDIIDKIINNKLLPFGSDQKAMLANMSESDLQKLSVLTVSAEKKETVENKKDDVQFTKEDRALLNSLKEEREKNLPAMRESVLKNYSNLSEKVVNKMDYETLTELHNGIKTDGKSFSGLSGNADEVETKKKAKGFAVNNYAVLPDPKEEKKDG